MSPNSHPSKAGSVVESDVSYNSIVKGWQTTGDQVNFQRTCIGPHYDPKGWHRFDSGTGLLRFFITLFNELYIQG